MERWLPVTGYEGRYEVSDEGQVRSVGFYSGNRWGTKTWRPGRVLKPSAGGSDHLTVILVDAAGRQSTKKVHRLVLLAFRGEPPAGTRYGLHRDDDKANNRLDNLYWGTQSQNGHDCVRNGEHVQARKDTCPRGHLLVEPNLVPSTSRRGGRGCLSCKRALAAHNQDRILADAGRVRTRYNLGPDGFQRRAGESVEDEADRRYAQLMGEG